MVINGMFLPTFGAGKSHSLGMPNIHINLASRHVQFNTLYRPRFVYTQQVPIQFFAFHRSSPNQLRDDRLSFTHAIVR